MKSGIVHAVTTIPVERSVFENETFHDLSHGNSYPAGAVERQLFYRDDLYKWCQYRNGNWRLLASENYIDTKIAADIATHAALTTGAHGVPAGRHVAETTVADLDLAAHKTRHQNGGGDEVSLAGLDGEPSTLTTHKGLTTGIHGVGALHVAGIAGAGNEAPLKSAFEDHDARHKFAGADALDLAGLLVGKMFLNFNFQTIDYLTVVKTGSAAETIGIVSCQFSTGATNGSVGRIRTSGDAVIIRQTGAALGFYVRNYGLIQTVSVIWLGVFRGVDVPSDTVRHVGFKIINGRVYASNADGTTQTITDTGITEMGTVGYQWSGSHDLVIFWPDVNTVKFYVDGVLKATHTTNLPVSGDSGRMILQIENTAATDQIVRFTRAAFVW